MVRDILSVMLLALIVTLPLSMYKYTYDQRIIKTYELLNDMIVNDIKSSIDVWGSEVIVEGDGLRRMYISAGPDKKLNTKDDIKVSCSNF